MTEQQSEAIRELVACGVCLAATAETYASVHNSPGVTEQLAQWNRARGVWEAVRGQRACRTRGCLGVAHGIYDTCPTCRTDEVTRCQ